MTAVPIEEHRAVAIDDDGLLLCPNCRFNFLHHGMVQVFSRREDAETVRSVIATDEGDVTTADIPNARSANPSERRDGIVVRFECEGCPAELALTIAQHKGNTILQWRVFVPTEHPGTKAAVNNC